MLSCIMWCSYVIVVDMSFIHLVMAWSYIDIRIQWIVENKRDNACEILKIHYMSHIIVIWGVIWSSIFVKHIEFGKCFQILINDDVMYGEFLRILLRVQPNNAYMLRFQYMNN